MRNDLYSDIITALHTASECGRFAEQHKGSELSRREALRQYGAKTLRRYKEQYGAPARTGGKANSKILYSVVRLNELKQAEVITRSVLEFECKIIERERKTHKIQ